jgi:hypothetical protein
MLSQKLRVAIFLLPLAATQSPLSSQVRDTNFLPCERLQLLDLVLATLSEDEAPFFDFASNNPSPRRSTSTCKVFPGDASWPGDVKWSLLNHTVGGALIKTIPVAAPCYPGLFYDADGCAYITAQWTNSSLQ